MKVMIGTIEAEVSEDGHDVRLPPPPATAKDALALHFLQADAGHASKPSIDIARWTAAGSQADAPAPAMARIGFDGLGTGLIVCVVIAGIAAARFFRKERGRTITPQARLDDPMDEAAFLKRYGGRVR